MPPKRKHSGVIATAAKARPRRTAARQASGSAPLDTTAARQAAVAKRAPRTKVPPQKSEPKEATAASSNTKAAKTVRTAVEVEKLKASKPPKKKGPVQKPSSNGESTAMDGIDGSERSYWLMKAEPESRLEKGIDVKFSIDDLAANEEPEPWDGKLDGPHHAHFRSLWDIRSL